MVQIKADIADMGDPAAPNEFKNYLYCSDLGQLPNP